MVIAVLIAGIAVGALAVWLVLREREAGLRRELDRERASADERIADFETAMKALASDALRNNNESFLELAQSRFDQKEQAVQQLVAPIKESLDKVGTEVKQLELARKHDVGALTQHLRTVAESSDRVRAETALLTTALRTSEVRGAWGEMQLRNAVETSGMLAYCDFAEQVTA